MSFAPKIDILSFIMTKLHVYEDHQQKSFFVENTDFQQKRIFVSGFHIHVISSLETIKC